MSNRKRPIGLDDELTFGKHRERPLWAVLEDDPEYVRWMVQDTDFELDNEAFDAYMDIARQVGWE